MEEIVKNLVMFGERRFCLCGCGKNYYQCNTRKLRMVIAEPYIKIEVFPRYYDDDEFDLDDVKSPKDLMKKVKYIKSLYK